MEMSFFIRTGADPSFFFGHVLDMISSIKIKINNRINWISSQQDETIQPGVQQN